uniref:Uncharacterized protein n=1 Tax=viral metagenome TaxID=1070528 RepID=A0A6M3KX00_9ZZZZ
MPVKRKGRKSLLRCDKKPKQKKINTGRRFARELIRKAKDELPKIYEIGMTHPDILEALGIGVNQYKIWNFRHGDDPALKELIAKINECHEKSMDTFFKWIGHKIVEHMSEGMSLEEIAGYYYTTVETLHRWIAEHDLRDFYEIGKARYEYFWKKMGRDAFGQKRFNTNLWQINMKNRWKSFGSGEKWGDHVLEIEDLSQKNLEDNRIKALNRVRNLLETVKQRAIADGREMERKKMAIEIEVDKEKEN